MSLQFILGAAGSATSEYLYEMVTRNAKVHPDGRYFVIVPEQFNMQAQKNLVRLSPNGCIMNIDVVSFPRLASYVFDETGVQPGEILTETGKNLLLRRSAETVRDQLRMMGGRIERPGYIAQIKSLLSEFQQYNISGENLDELCETQDLGPALRNKLFDVRCIQQAFDEIRKDRFITSEELLKVLASAVPSSAMLKGAHLYFAEFTGFTPVQMILLEELLKTAADLTVSLMMDPEEGLPSPERKHDLFYLTGKSVSALSRTAAKVGAEVKESIVLERQIRYAQGSGLEQLERRLLRFGKSIPEKISPLSSPTDITLLESSQPLQEAVFAARRIWQMTHEEGYRYRDIAVICSDLEEYRKHVERQFEAYDIPCFIDQKQSVTQNPCLETVRAAMAVVRENWSYDTVMHFLRMGYTDLTEVQIDHLDNYILAAGIRGRSRWTKPFTSQTRTMDETELALCEAARQIFVGQFLPFSRIYESGSGTVSSYIQAVRTLLESLRMSEDTVLIDEQELSHLPLPTAMQRRTIMEYEQIYEKMDTVLTEAERLLGDEIIDRHVFEQILDAGFEEVRIGVIPPGIDQVHVGDMVRTRLTDVRVLFLLGASDQAVPSRDENGGLLSQYERQMLAKRQIELAPDARQDSFIQRFYLYQCLTMPSEKLYVAWSLSDGAGQSRHPSYLVYHLMKIMPGLQADSADRLSDSMQTPQGRFGRLADLMRRAASDGEESDEGVLKELLRSCQSSREESRKADMLLHAAGFSQKEEQDASLTGQLYEDPMRLSISRLESFAACPFRFFADYGLKLSERERLVVQPADTGTFMHDVMQLYARSVSAAGQKAWNEISLREEQALVDTCIAAVLEQDARMRALFEDTAKSGYVINRLRRALYRSAWAVTQQIRAGSMLPSQFEIPFSDRFVLRDGEVLLSGRIDRIDTAQDGDTQYIKVVDYKSAARKMDMNRFLYGSSLQLPVYLSEAVKYMKQKNHWQRITPSAVFYEQLADPLLRADAAAAGAMDEVTQQAAFLKALRPEGLVNADETIWRLMDESTGPSEGSVYIPLRLKKDGQPQAETGMRRLAATSEFESLMEYADKMVINLAQRIAAGDRQVSPLQESRQRTACTYCGLKDVCGFDLRLPDCHYRLQRQIDKETAWEMIRNQELLPEMHRKEESGADREDEA